MEMLGAVTGVVPRLYRKWGPTYPPLMSRTTLARSSDGSASSSSSTAVGEALNFSHSPRRPPPSWHPLLLHTIEYHLPPADLVRPSRRTSSTSIHASPAPTPKPRRLTVRHCHCHCHVSTARRCAARLLHLPPDRHRGAQRALGQPVPLQPRSPPELHAAMDRRERVRSRAQRRQPPQPPQVPGLQGEDPPRGAARQCRRPLQQVPARLQPRVAHAAAVRRLGRHRHRLRLVRHDGV